MPVDGAIIVAGDKFVMKGVECHTWHDHGMQFTAQNSAPPRRQPPRWLVYHWTASERRGEEGARKLYEGMLARKVPLSVEFMICNDGIVWQFADPADVRCRHCSRVNDISIGVEVSSLGWPKPGRPRIDRPTYKSPPLHKGWKPTLYDYYPAQQAAANALADAVCEATGIPRHVEQEPWDRRPEGYFEDVAGGVCGHMHAAWLSKKHPKVDPGPNPLIKIAQHFASTPVPTDRTSPRRS